jgi:hypothetical protein
MAYYGSRRKQYLNVLAFPATKLAGASTIVSSTYFPFEGQSPGGAKLVLRCADKSKITADTILVQAYVSFNGGTSFLAFGGNTGSTGGWSDLKSGTGAIINLKSVPLAPRMYVQATFSAAATLSAGHGLSVDLEFEELYPESNLFESWPNYSTADTKAGNDSNFVRYGQSFYFGDTMFNPARGTNVAGTPTITGGLPTRVLATIYVADRSKITGRPVPITVQSSLDGTNWFHADSLVLATLPTPGTGIFLAQEELHPVPTWSLVGKQNNEPGLMKPTVFGPWVRAVIGKEPNSPATTFGLYALGLGHGLKVFFSGIGGGG